VRETFDVHLKKLRLGAAKELRSAREMRQWWRRKDKELVNSNSLTIPLIKLPNEGTWAEMWRKKRKREPTNGQENHKITMLPTSNGQHPVKITHRVILLMTS
jgi:hypothetical protein